MSTPVEASVSIASVRRGMISETAPTNVVLPAPNPPAMTIFVEAWFSESECFKATQGPSYQFVALIPRRTLGQRPVHPKVTRQHQIAHQDARDAQRQIQPGRDFRDRRAADAQSDDLASRIVWWPPVDESGLQRLNRRYHRKVDVGVGPARRQGVRANQVPLTWGRPGLVAVHRGSRVRHGPASGLHHAAHPFDEDGHLVADLTDVG